VQLFVGKQRFSPSVHKNELEKCGCFLSMVQLVGKTAVGEGKSSISPRNKKNQHLRGLEL
jgi:hypothetical protein